MDGAYDGGTEILQTGCIDILLNVLQTVDTFCDPAHAWYLR